MAWYGSRPESTIAFRKRAAPGRSGNAYTRAFEVSGLVTTRIVAFVMIPRVPSAPRKSEVRSASWPPASALGAVVRSFPSGRTTSRFAITSRRRPPRSPPKPVLPELIAPPTVLPTAFVGTNGSANPFDSTKSSRSFQVTPASVVTVRPSESSARTRFIFRMSMSTPPRFGTEPPHQPVPPPRGVICKRLSSLSLTRAATSSVVCGRATKSGYSFHWSRATFGRDAKSWLYTIRSNSERATRSGVAGVECRQLHADFALHLHPAAAEFPEGSAETAEEVRDFLRAEQQEHRDDDQDDDPFDALDLGGHAPDVPSRHAGSPSDQGARSYEVFARPRRFAMRTATT